MQIREILVPDRTQAQQSLGSKKRVLEHAAMIVERAAARGIDDASGSLPFTAAQVFDALVSRERLGSTAIGEGVAVPHCRIPNCAQTLGVLLTLNEGIDFDAPDGKLVDLVFVLIVPAHSTDEHLQLLARLASLFNEAAFRQSLRDARSNGELYDAAVRAEAPSITR